ncbi:MAG TPA: CARDB domain-containing protein [Tepidisphaeraceae bacterium]|nr:CARDB domain-containing protein [Tepidisphaeraceae bacterium]
MRQPPIEPLEHRRLLAADLTAVIDLPPTYVSGGGAIRPTVTVYNAGDDAVRAIWTMRFVLSPDPVLGNGNDITIGSETRSFMGPGGALTTRPALLLPFAPAAGSYHVGVVLDTMSAVRESIETNNVAFTSAPTLNSFSGSGVLPVSGTEGRDHIVVREQGAQFQIEINGVHVHTALGVNVTGLRVTSGAGNDVIELFTTRNVTLDAGDGNDTVVSGSGDDVLDGGSGFDRIFGGDGDDHLIGGGSADRLFGEAGNDTVSGHGGHDHLHGGPGNDWLIGGPGHDYFFANDGHFDIVIGNIGDDRAESDPFDELVSVNPVAWTA